MKRSVMSTHRLAPTHRQMRAHVLAEAKRDQTVSVCIPARNEAATIGGIVSAIRQDLMEQVPLVDELIVMDHDSADATASVATRAGALVVPTDRVARFAGPAVGKGDVLWRSVRASRGDVIVWLDADLEGFSSDYVTGLLGPLLLDERVSLVKAVYDRTLDGAASAGGRVTELTARPALRLLVPELAHVRQPLGGEYAIRRTVAEAVPFEVDYGVEIGLLIDVMRVAGVPSIAQVDLGTRVHRNRPLHELHDQAVEVLRTVLSRSGQVPAGRQRPAWSTITAAGGQGSRPAATGPVTTRRLA